VTISFQVDDAIRKVAQGYANDTVRFAIEHHHVDLDGTDNSIQLLEPMFAHLDEDRARQAPPRDLAAGDAGLLHTDGVHSRGYRHRRVW
jgi:hypothetical protein